MRGCGGWCPERERDPGPRREHAPDEAEEGEERAFAPMQQCDSAAGGRRVRQPHQGIGRARLRDPGRHDGQRAQMLGVGGRRPQRGCGGGDAQAGEAPVIEELGRGHRDREPPQRAESAGQQGAEREREQPRREHGQSGRRPAGKRVGRGREQGGGRRDREPAEHTRSTWCAVARSGRRRAGRSGPGLHAVQPSRSGRGERATLGLPGGPGPPTARSRRAGCENVDMVRIDLNSDLGESFGRYSLGDDAAVLAAVSSANVACGFHAGDPLGIRATCRAAAASGVAIGAHPGYRDLAGFGRRFIAYEPEELAAEVVYQLGALRGLARSVGSDIRYVKPHGGLYHAIASREDQAGAVARAVGDFDADLPLLVPAGSVIERVARDAGLVTRTEAFADRGYRADGTLVPRGEAGALLEAGAAVAQAIRIATTGSVTAVDGTELTMAPDSICVHGDDPEAVRMAHEIRSGLERAGVEIGSFV